MAIYVDTLMHHGWWLYGRPVKSCHLFTDDNVDELHEFAYRIRLKREWYQHKPGFPHYDLTASKREAAIRAGAWPVTAQKMVRILKRRKRR